jgi:peptidoglycan/xylan/chitin deacetylase (PgdA/CDA1 family)
MGQLRKTGKRRRRGARIALLGAIVAAALLAQPYAKDAWHMLGLQIERLGGPAVSDEAIGLEPSENGPAPGGSAIGDAGGVEASEGADAARADDTRQDDPGEGGQDDPEALGGRGEAEGETGEGGRDDSEALSMSDEAEGEDGEAGEDGGEDGGRAEAEPAGRQWEPVPQPKDYGYREYQDLYPELYASRPAEWSSSDMTVFLTFDDGPTAHTGQALDTLRDKGVKATFFVVGSSVRKLGPEGKDLLNRMVDEGHSLAIHCDVHDYRRIYASVEAFLADFNAAYELIYEATGVHADIYRFPGGSVNSFNGPVRDELIGEMERRGFTYYDWNLTAGDSSPNLTADSAYSNAVSKAGRKSRIILLMHDTKKQTVKALPRIIDRYRELGYSFECLTNEDKPITL